MTPIRAASVVGLLATSLLLGSLGPALAQQQANTSGRALDANLQVGSGGVNQQAPQIDYRLRNDIVTGNVTAGRGFRGTIDYAAPGEFRGDLGSDDLFQFRAESLSSAPNRLNTVPLLQNYVTGGGTSFYRSYTSLPSTRPIRSPVFQQGRIEVEGFTTELPVAYDTGRLLGGNLVGGVGDVTPPPTTGTLQLLPDGRVLELNVSPLLGIRPVRTWPGQEALEAELLQPNRRPAQIITEDEDVDAGDLDELDADGEPGTEDEVDARLQGRLEPGTFRPGGPGLPQDTAWQGMEAARIAPGLVLGQQLQGRVGAERSDRPDTATQARLQRLSAAMFDPARAGRQTTGDVYADLLAALRGDQAAAQRIGQADRLVPEAQPGDDADAPRDRDAAQAPADRRLSALRDPTQRELELAEQARQAATPQPRRNGGAAPDGDAAAPGDPAAGDAGDAGEAQQPEALNELLSRLDYDLPPLATLAGSRQTRIAATMRQAEQELAQGNYLVAEGLYRQVLTDQPETPLAQVGLVHAQLGAGMIRSSALTLRRLFAQHPELVAAKYDESLLPAEARLRWVQQELQGMISESAGAEADAGLVMAYLGYQAGSRQLIRYGLAVAEAAAPRDPLLPVLRRIWLDGGDQQTDTND